jgi:hypothetical protein
MVVLGTLRNAVVQAPVVKEDAADYAEVGEQAEGAEDGSAASSAAAVKQVFHREVAFLLQDGGDHRAPGRRYTVATRFEFKADGF